MKQHEIMPQEGLIISRVLAHRNYALYAALQEEVTPMLTDLHYIKEVQEVVNSMFPDLDARDKQIYFASCVYYFYCPASFVGTKVQKLPIGIRDEAAKVLGYTNPENINALRTIGEVYMKNPTKRARIEQVKEYFKKYSVRDMDWELNLV
ncbi:MULTISPECIES: hypothetical protein [unclassified Pedobacter]|uniref:hypothetical protein n=1 Tax=unclassified Pedobacter TaxID=2628915 RepID=UPI0014240B5D|nr:MULTISPECIES: hypothetical protein [unclassified Pedobacter]NII81708.1 hypothetical protein [Pedobacter sp. SG908]NMN35712.1 hypothetical protein [Pedobacter sp. SG918]